MSELVHIDLGKIAYLPAMDFQETLVRKVQTDPQKAFLVTARHSPPVITLGKRGKESDILATSKELTENNIEIFHTKRGGQVTIHGPGQLMGYSILSLQTRPFNLREYVTSLEQTVIDLLKNFDIPGRRIEGTTGVFVKQRKIASIGVAVSKWVTYHGLCLNVSPKMNCFQWIVPCGNVEEEHTSISKLTGREISITRTSSLFVECFKEVFGFDVVKSTDKSQIS